MTSTSDVTTSPAGSLGPLTTPFVQNPSCASLWILTSGTISGDYRTRLLPILASDAAHQDFSSCQPSGWDNAQNFAFSPAVCPESWTYYDMQELTSWVDKTARIAEIESMAYCCASGMTLRHDHDFPIESLTDQCYRSFETGETTITITEDDSSSTRLFTHGIQVHRPWTITWASSDTSSLTPSLPSLTTDMTIPAWVPGQTVPAHLYDSTSTWDGKQGAGKFYGLLIGLPVGIGLVIIALVVWGCISNRREKKRKLTDRLTRELEELGGVEAANDDRQAK